jgi:CheY-like chemotaxis protein
VVKPSLDKIKGLAADLAQQESEPENSGDGKVSLRQWDLLQQLPCPVLIFDLTGHVHLVSSAQDAINYAIHHSVDLILLDLRIRGTNGLEVYTRMQNKGVSLPTFVITVYADEESAQIDSLRRLSVEKVFRKPIDPLIRVN